MTERIVSGRTPWKLMLLGVAVAAIAVLLWAKSLVGLSNVRATDGVRSVAADQSGQVEKSGAQLIDLTEKQTGSLKIGPVEWRNFEVLKTAVGTIAFNEHMLVQVFSQYPGKIQKAFFCLRSTALISCRLSRTFSPPPACSSCGPGRSPA